MKRNRMRLNVMACLLALFAAGCGKAAEEASEAIIEANMPDGGNVEIDAEGGSIRFQGPDGSGAEVQFEAGESVALPENFPADVPVPEGVTWSVVQSSTAEGAGGIVVQGATATPLAEVAAFVKSGATGQGWTETQSMSQAGELEIVSYSKDERQLSYTLGKADGETTVMIVSQ